MANIQERYGRTPIDQPTLCSAIPILGVRHIETPIRNMIPIHSLSNYQIIFVLHGHYTTWVNGKTYELNKQEFIITKPGDTIGYIQGVIAIGEHYFMQLQIKGTIIQDYESKLAQLCGRPFMATDEFQQAFEAILNEHRKRDTWSLKIIENQLTILFLNLLRIHQQNLGNDVELLHSNDFVEAIDCYIDKHLDVEIHISTLAQHCGYSENHFRTLFKTNFGTSPLKYIHQRRIDKARSLLLEKKLSITQIAFDLGFKSSQYFATFFKKHTTFTPLEYREEVDRMQHSKPQKTLSAGIAAAQLDSHFNMLKLPRQSL